MSTIPDAGDPTAERVSVDLSDCPSPHSLANRLGRMAWGVVWLLLFRPTPKVCHPWRRMLLRLFGARIGRNVHVHASCRIWAPWNLTLADHSCLGPDVDCYCVAPITIGPHGTISQYAHLCTASHDFEHPHMPLTTAPIRVGSQAWICAGAFVAPGLTIGDGAVVGARAVVTRDVCPWQVVAGNPATCVKQRTVRGG
jgi:putative colanic acid biosynthesis acetyltransferase WcaF